MKYIIHHIDLFCNEDDSIVIEKDTIEEIREEVNRQIIRRDWKKANCWSEEAK